MGVEYPSFVKRIAGGIDLWSPTVTEDWSKDMNQGRAYGMELISHMKRTGQPTFLQHVVKAMVGHGTWSGVEVGFFQLISAEIISSDQMLGQQDTPSAAQLQSCASRGILCHRARNVARAEGAEAALTTAIARDGE